MNRYSSLHMGRCTCTFVHFNHNTLVYLSRRMNNYYHRIIDACLLGIHIRLMTPVADCYHSMSSFLNSCHNRLNQNNIRMFHFREAFGNLGIDTGLYHFYNTDLDYSKCMCLNCCLPLLDSTNFVGNQHISR